MPAPQDRYRIRRGRPRQFKGQAITVRAPAPEPMQLTFSQVSLGAFASYALMQKDAIASQILGPYAAARKMLGESYHLLMLQNMVRSGRPLPPGVNLDALQDKVYDLTQEFAVSAKPYISQAAINKVIGMEGFGPRAVLTLAGGALAKSFPTAATVAGVSVIDAISSYTRSQDKAKAILLGMARSGEYLPPEQRELALQLTNLRARREALSIIEKSPAYFLFRGYFENQYRIEAEVQATAARTEYNRRILQLGGSPDLRSVDSQAAYLSYFAPLAAFGSAAVRKYDIGRVKHLSPEILEMASQTLSEYGAEAVLRDVRRSLYSRGPEAAAKIAAVHAAARGDISAIFAMKPFLRTEADVRRKQALRVLDLTGEEEFAEARASIAEAKLDVVQAGGKYVSKDIIEEFKTSLKDVTKALKASYKEIASIAGERSPEALEAKAQYLQAQAREAGFRTKAIDIMLQQSLGKVAASSQAALVATAQLPMRLEPEAHLEAGRAQIKLIDKQIEAYQTAIKQLPPGPIRDQYLAQVAQLRASKVSIGIEARTGYYDLQTALFELQKTAMSPAITYHRLYNPTAYYETSTELAKGSYAYYAGLASDNLAPAGIRIQAAANAYQALSSVYESRAGYYQSVYENRMAAMISRAKISAGMADLADLFPDSQVGLFSAAFGSKAELAAFNRLVAYDENAPYSVRMSALSAYSDIASSLPGEALSFLGSGIERLSVPYKIQAVIQAGQEHRLGMFPAPLGGLGVLSRGIRMRQQRVATLNTMMLTLAEGGLLTPQMELSLVSEREDTLNQIAEAMSRLAYGAENRLPALMVNTAGIGRFGIGTLAAINNPYASIGYGGMAGVQSVGLAALAGALSGGQPDTELIKKMDELIAAVRQGFGLAGLPIPSPRRPYSEPMADWEQ